MGRATELAELNRWTTSGEPQVCVLTGVRGSGRRHLARAFAAAAAERDSAWVVPIDPSSPAPLTAAVRAAHHPELAATTEEDAFEALARFAASADRPVVAVVQPGSDGEPVDLVTRLALVPSLRILTMATSAAGHPAWRGIELGPVDPYELGRRLGLQAGLTERLAVVAHGHPGTTLDLVAGLARSGRLTADSSGIGLAVDEPLDPPAEPAARARAAVANLPPSGSIRAAALLRPLPGDVWRALLGALGLEQDEDAAAWSRAGLVRQADGTPWFHDPAVRGIVADSIPEAERARIFEAAAAATEGRPELDAEHAEWAWRARRAGAAKLLMAAAKRHLAPRREVAWRLHRFLEENRLARGVDLDALMNNGVALKVNTGDLSGALTELDELPRPQSAVATALRVQVLVRLGNIVEASTWFSTLPPTEGTAHWDLAMVFALHANDLERAAQLVEGRSGAERERLALALALATNDAAGFRAALARHRALEGGLWADAQEALGAAAGLTPAVSRETLEAWALQALARPYPYLHTLFCACLVAWAVQHAPDEVAVRLATCTESAAYTGARQHWVRDVLERVAGFSGVHEAAIRALAATQGPI